MLGKAKGTALIEAIRMLRTYRERTVEVLPKELHGYLDQRILKGTWYPESDYLQLLRALSKVIKTPWERLGALSARNDLTTIYANLMRRRHPEEVVTVAPVLWRNYHDTGIETVTTKSRLFRFEIVDFAAVDADYCKCVGGYNRELIEMAGGTVLWLRKVRCTANGDASCIWEYEWTGGPDDGGT